MRVASLLVLQTVLLIAVAGLAGTSDEMVTVLEIHPTAVLEEAGNECPGAPPVLLLDVDAVTVVIGEESGPTSRLRDLDALRARLKVFKAERTDRETLIIQLDDDVDYARAMAIFDIAAEVDLAQLQVFVGAGKSFTTDHWTRPLPTWADGL